MCKTIDFFEPFESRVLNVIDRPKNTTFDNQTRSPRQLDKKLNLLIKFLQLFTANFNFLVGIKKSYATSHSKDLRMKKTFKVD